MRALIGLVILGILFYVTAVAQFADPSPADEPVEEGQPINQRAPEDWLAMCLADWDSQTHMTKTQWGKTCERVSRERGYFQLNTGASPRSARAGATDSCAPRPRSADQASADSTWQGRGPHVGRPPWSRPKNRSRASKLAFGNL